MVRMLERYDWPGNVRELENFMERALVLAAGRPLTPELIGPPGQAERRWRPLRSQGSGRGGELQSLIEQLVRQGIQSLPDGSLKEHIVDAVERELIEQVLRQESGVQVKAAQRLGINRNTLHKKVDEYERTDNTESPG
jgi:DNA-binding NtrC family response regulator